MEGSVTREGVAHPGRWSKRNSSHGSAAPITISCRWLMGGDEIHVTFVDCPFISALEDGEH